MNCPVCVSMQLVMTERAGIEIDYCPHCRGVWLDRGELDKIIERTNQNMAASPAGFTTEMPREVGPAQPAPFPAQQPHDYARERAERERAERERTERERDEREYRERLERERAHYRHHDYDDDYRYKKKKKRGGFLEDLFDFD